MKQKTEGYSALAMAKRVARAEVSALDASVRRVMAARAAEPKSSVATASTGSAKSDKAAGASQR